jgi:hypothetical protein
LERRVTQGENERPRAEAITGLRVLAERLKYPVRITDAGEGRGRRHGWTASGVAGARGAVVEDRHTVISPFHQTEGQPPWPLPTLCVF